MKENPLIVKENTSPWSKNRCSLHNMNSKNSSDQDQQENDLQNHIKKIQKKINPKKSKTKKLTVEQKMIKKLSKNEKMVRNIIETNTK